MLITLAFSATASAQRTMSGQPSLRVSALYNGQSAGAEAFFEQYTLSGYWQAGVQGNLYRVGLVAADGNGGRNTSGPDGNGLQMDYAHVLAQGGYLFRLTGTRSRSLSLYAGGGVLAGAEVLDPWRALPGNVDLSRERYAFVYGAYGSAVLEWFFGRKVAVLLQAGAPLTFGSAVTVVRWNVGLGLKWNL